MFRKVIGTMGTRVLSAGISFAAWIVNARCLGAENVGTIGLIIFSTAIIQLFTNFIAGSALIYQTPRVGISRLMAPVYILIPVIAVVSALLMEITGRLVPAADVIPEGHFLTVLALGVVISYASANYMFLLGLENIRWFNLLNLIQAAGSILVLLILVFIAGQRDVMSFCWALLGSYSAVFLISTFLLLPEIKTSSNSQNLKALLTELLRFGTFVQFANIFQTLNYRLSLKFSDLFLGRAMAGILTIGLQVAESLWIISRSLSTVLYSRLSNTTDRTYAEKLTLSFIKIAATATLVAMIILISIPASVFIFLFSEGFGEIKPVIASLAGGIVMLSISVILSAFFSSINRPVHNMIGSLAGLIFTITFGLMLVPILGLPGAGYAASMSYSAVTIYQLIVFFRITGLKLRDLLFTREEFSRFRDMVRSGR